ncbi:ASCH domain-containing protein [uncultured Psychrobacter sp.]|uniref:ASCH domain-containing protein n=1 Tax=uncultured Psychrobacter sp. TaxID=259303 RepID=UPI003458CC6C
MTMNDRAQAWLNVYKAEVGENTIQANAWQFGTQPDQLAKLVVEGKKTATCSLYKLYTIEKEPLPQVGQYQIILSSQDEPVALIRTHTIDIEPMKEVPVEFALAEGEGDGAYQFWWDEHLKFFNELACEFNISFDSSDLLVCERFEVVKINNDIRL